MIERTENSKDDVNEKCFPRLNLTNDFTSTRGKFSAKKTNFQQKLVIKPKSQCIKGIVQNSVQSLRSRTW